MLGRWSSVLAGAALLALVCSQSAHARTLPDPPPGYAAFTVHGSNGFDVTILAYPAPTPDSTGSIAVLAEDDHSVAIYRTSATVTDSTVEADLGKFGQISVKEKRTGRKRAVPDSCEGETMRQIAATRYEGKIEFHGEEGFTEVSASGAPFDYRIYRAFACATEGGHPAGNALPGARLSVHRLPEENELMLDAVQDRPGAAITVSVQIDETRGDFVITRATGARTRAGSAAFRFDPQLRHATLSPPAPFAGHATFRRGASAGNRWTGNLTVDLPGDADYPLTGPRLEVSLVHPSA
jgi:hypothetical protein